MDLNALRVMQAVVEAGSFAKAAEQLHKTQSAISYQVSKLEQQLGGALFDRSQYRAQLTPLGSRILEEGQRLLLQADNLDRIAEQFRLGWEPNLEVVIDGMLPLPPILQVLKSMTDMDIPTRIQLRTEFLGGVQQRFERAQADLMLALVHEPSEQLEQQRLAPINTMLMTSPAHPLAGQSHCTLETLRQYVELTVHDSSFDRAHGGRQTFGGEKVFYLSDFAAKKAAICQGLGFGWLPEFLVEDELAEGKLVEVSYIGGARLSYTPRLVWRASQPLGKAGLHLKAQLAAAFS